jgi:hypothetical protein
MVKRTAVGGAAAAAVLLTPTAALAQEVVVDPAEAVVGAPLAVTGTGCEPEEEVDLFLEPEVGDPIDFGEDAITADAEGAFEADGLAVPEAEPGPFNLAAECGEERFVTTFVVLPPPTQQQPQVQQPPTGGVQTGMGGGTDVPELALAAGVAMAAAGAAVAVRTARSRG